MITAKILLVYLLQSANITGVTIDTSKIDIQEASCLAENIFYEARNEDIKGQFAVASVTINRTKDSRFPDTVCEVVSQTAYSKLTNRVVCAFSWYCENNRKGKYPLFLNKDGTINQAVVDQFQVAIIIAITMLNGDVEDNTKGSTHFHNPNISNPAWKNELIRTVRYGNHDFYKLRGTKG